MEKSIKELNQLKANFEELEKKFKEVGGASTSEKDEMYNVMYNMLSSVHRRIDYIQSDMYGFMDKHCDASHIPPILSPGKMQKALAALGLDDDYEVKKKIIYANTNKGLVVELDYKK